MFKQNENRAPLSLVFVLVFSSLVSAQSTALSKVDLFKTLKPGQWIQIEGTPQRDMSVQAAEVKVLTGDFQEDDWEVFGTVRNVNRGTKDFEILALKIKTDDNTDFQVKDKNRKFAKFEDLKAGMLVEVEGSFLKDGTFLAEEIQDETVKKADEANSVTLVGKTEKVDAVRRTITLMGVTFIVNDQTRVRSAIK